MTACTAKRVIATYAAVAAMSAQAADGVLAPTPPTGWNSWNHFATRIDDRTVRAQADAMVASGMRDVGCRYINIDDGWEGARDAKLRPHVDDRVSAGGAGPLCLAWTLE